MQPLLMTFLTALVSSVVSAIVAAFISRVKIKKQATVEARQEAAELKKLIEQNTKMTCRLSIYDEHFSIDEKLDAYEVYRDHGWNHQTKTYMDEQVGMDVDEYLARHRKGR